ncbi:hypothetical protein NM688_g6475 [Phlebia brevispora]|uniref:Uncharacterized protein n=1 Tax=Phlebia brevispora TaxID=194682 RepID=A0ACC1SFQ3_9APHY|nr:hypothetical protein NM688_g6475 [Phlebia brevispora]
MATSIPNKQKALVLPAKNGQFVIEEVDVPTLASGEVLVRADAVALNPADYMVQDRDIFNSAYPLILGWEAAGVVVQLGEGVTSLAVGDKVLHPALFWEGYPAFRLYNSIPADLCGKIPLNVTIDQAASIPLALDTAVLGLYVAPGRRGGANLTPPWQEGGREKYRGRPIFIFGGAGAVGQMVIQLCKLSGFSPIIATASLKNEHYLKSLGATHVIDRNVPTSSLPDIVKGITKEPIPIVYDTVSSEETQNAGYDILASDGTLLLVFQRVQVAEDKLSAGKLISSVSGSPWLPDRRRLSAELYENVTAMFESGELKPNHIEVLPNGLAGVLAGLDRLRKKEVSAKKLIIRPQDTP